VTLVLYQHPFASYCQKVLIALYELDLPFESHLIEGEEGRAALARIWPPAGMPVLRDEDAGLTLPESTTIIEYLDAVADGPLVPADAGEALQALDTAYGVLDDRLAEQPWAGGETFTMADCAIFPALFYLRGVHRWEGDNVRRYYRDLLARPSIARVVDDARPYRDLFPLPWPADQDGPF